VNSVAISTNSSDGEVVQVRFKSELTDQKVPELIKITRTQVVGSMADLTYHVMMCTIRVGQLVVQTVTYRDFSHHSKPLEKVEGTVDRGKVP
jgi:hypothetical protein